MKKVMNEYPDLVEPYIELGDLFLRAGRNDAAIAMYQKADRCEMPVNSPLYYDKNKYDFFGSRRLAFLLPLVGRHAEGLEYAKKTLKYTPGDEDLIKQIETLEKMLHERP